MKNAYDGVIPDTCPDWIPGYSDLNTEESEETTPSESSDANYPMFFGIAILAIIPIYRRKV